MSRDSSKISFSGAILQEIISAKSLPVGTFAQQLGVSRQSYANWIKENRIPPRRLLEIKKVLSLSSEDFKTLMKPAEKPLKVYFKTIRNISISDQQKIEVEQLSKEYFRLEKSRIGSKKVKSVITTDDPRGMAEAIVGQLGLSLCHINLENTLHALEAFNIHVIFHDFGEEFVDQKGCAACAIGDDRSLIFVNSREAIEDVLSRVYHEACHVFSDHHESTDHNEKFCDQVAYEVVTPRGFFLERKDELKKLFAADIRKSPLLAKELARILSAGFSGVIATLKEHKIIGKDTERYLWGAFHREKSHRVRVLDKISPKLVEDPKEFWQRALSDPDNKKFVRLQTLVQEALIEGRISIGRASEILGVDEKTVEELAIEWQQELEAADLQD
jgi:hypothetical protein